MSTEKIEDGVYEDPLEKNNDMSTDEGRLFKHDPSINVISKEEFENRVEKVFHLLWKTLSKSFGPYGAPTLIYNFPYSHVTKDGYTIMKNLSMNAAETLVDQAIANMASDICGRLNYSVGDGTTTAVIATDSIYKQYRNLRESFTREFALPRDIMKQYESIKEDVVTQLTKKVKTIRSIDRDELRSNIHDVVYVSSNGDEVMTNYIADLYGELGCPGITCELAADGVTKAKLINGYKYDLTINDKLYINSDDQTMKLDNADVIILSTKVSKGIYENILKPLNFCAQQCGRHLIVAAPYYDETTLRQIISRDLNAEWNKKKDVNMVLTSYRATSSHARRLIEDFAVLTNTTVIDRELAGSIMEEMGKGTPIYKIFNIFSRNIDSIYNIIFETAEDSEGKSGLYQYGVDEIPDGYAEPELIETPIRLGYVKGCSLGLNTSIFSEFVYDEEKYQHILSDAKENLSAMEAKYQKLGTFNLEVSQAQERLYALNLKMGLIEVGADSELSQKLLKDAVDDAIKAAASAFNHGIILGCNVNLIQSIEEVKELSNEKYGKDSVNTKLLTILEEGFMDVYRTVLRNGFDDIEINGDTVEEATQNVKNYFDETMDNADNLFADEATLEKVVGLLLEKYQSVTIQNVIIYYSIMTNQVFDLSVKKFCTTVINSTQTDEEILKATIDLISLLIVGNQMVITQRHNF